MTKFRIKEICKEQGITLAELAQRMSVTASAVTQYSKADNISTTSLIKIADALGVALDDLVVREGGNINGFVEVNGRIYRITKKEHIKALLEEL